jgi:DNA-binding FrmR family transcriptional regulator
MPLIDERREKVILRLKTARGHIEGILGMVESNAHCIDLLRQLFAVRSALEGVSHLVVEHHLERCFHTLVQSEEEREAVAELLGILAYDTRFL